MDHWTTQNCLTFILSKANNIVYIYRDDGLTVVLYNKRKYDKIRTKLHKIFKGMDNDITVENNRKVVQFLDIDRNLLNENISSFMKPNTDLIYANTAPTTHLV